MRCPKNDGPTERGNAPAGPKELSTGDGSEPTTKRHGAEGFARGPVTAEGRATSDSRLPAREKRAGMSVPRNLPIDSHGLASGFAAALESRGLP
jgi:hypothetical protein